MPAGYNMGRVIGDTIRLSAFAVPVKGALQAMKSNPVRVAVRRMNPEPARTPDDGRSF